MVPASDVLPLMQAGGLEKAIWLWPIERIAGVLVHLYTQRESIKTTIFEITGIADIMRGSSAASETLGAMCFVKMVSRTLLVYLAMLLSLKLLKSMKKARNNENRR